VAQRGDDEWGIVFLQVRGEFRGYTTETDFIYSELALFDKLLD